MVFQLRCDHCDAMLSETHIERQRKRFCCSDCAQAFARGEMKAISPHGHESSAAVLLSSRSSSLPNAQGGHAPTRVPNPMGDRSSVDTSGTPK